MRLSYYKEKEHQWQDKFDQNLAELSDFLIQYDRFPTQKDNPVLNKWLKAIMYKYRLKKLEDVYVEKLDAIGMLWNAKDIYWHEQYKEAKKQLTEKKQLIDKAENQDLYKWLAKQLALLKSQQISGRQKDLIIALQKLIQEISPDIVVEHRSRQAILEAEWENKYDRLVAFRLQNPRHWSSANAKSLDEDRLAKWCYHQRKQYRNQTLPPNRLAKLREIGFVFNLKENIWNQKFEKVQDHLLVETDWSDLSLKLREWCTQQYDNFADLSIYQQKLLQSIRFLESRPEVSTWEKWLAEIKEYLLQNKKLPGNEDKRRYGWLLRQKRKFRDNKLSSDQQEKLTAIGVVLTLRRTNKGK